MENELREYSGFLSLSEIPSSVRNEVQRAAGESGLEVDVGQAYIEFEYSGRDSNRFVVSFLSKLARIIQDADGEILCEQTFEGKDPLFEFYRIKGGCLFRQIGQLVRGAEEKVS